MNQIEMHVEDLETVVAPRWVWVPGAGWVWERDTYDFDPEGME